MPRESFDARCQRIQDRLRESDDEEAADLIDELYGLWYEANDKIAARKKPKHVDDTYKYVTLPNGERIPRGPGHWGQPRRRPSS